MKIFSLTPIRNQILEAGQTLVDPTVGEGVYRAGKDKRTDLYATCDWAILRAIMGENFQASLSDADRASWAKHINSFARIDGTYKDALTTHSHLHANGMVIGALGVLGGKQKYPVSLYAAFEQESKIENWLEGINWAGQWQASHEFWGGLHCFSESARCTPAWKKRVFSWLNAHVDEQTGWWKKGVPHDTRHDPLGGSVHILPMYQHQNEPFPYPERVIDSVLALQLENGCWLESKRENIMGYLELDALYAYRFMGQFVPDYRKDEVLASVARFGETAQAYWQEKGEALLAGHPHFVLAAVGCWGLLQQFFPENYTDTNTWTDIFSDARFYQTQNVEVLA